MFRGLYTAVSGMQTNQRMLDITSNNMANVNTSGFKKDVLASEAFSEALLKKINGKLPTDPVRANGTVVVEREGEAFKLSTDRGFFTVDGQNGTSYSRELGFAIDENGYLRTYHRDSRGRIDASEGNFVLNSQGQRIQVANNNIDINQQGQLLVDGQVAGDLVYVPGPGILGTINSGRRFERTYINFTQGTLEETGNNLDFAIDGEGFFRVMGPNGEMYTRNGSFLLSETRELITHEGYPILGQNGPIMVPEGEFRIETNGELMVNGEIINRIDVINITNVKDLDKYGHSYYILREDVDMATEDFDGQILQGFLEGSNINPIDEMVEMINIMRSYEANSKVAKAYDDILQRAVNDIGRV